MHMDVHTRALAHTHTHKYTEMAAAPGRRGANRTNCIFTTKNNPMCLFFREKMDALRGVVNSVGSNSNCSGPDATLPHLPCHCEPVPRPHSLQLFPVRAKPSPLTCQCCGEPPNSVNNAHARLLSRGGGGRVRTTETRGHSPWGGGPAGTSRQGLGLLS